MGSSDFASDRVHGSPNPSPRSSASTEPGAARPGSASERALRGAVVTACLDMNRLGLNQGSSGNISVRLSQDMLLTPSAISYDVLRPNMIVRMSLADGENGFSGRYRPSSEWRLHRDILKARPEVGAVVHCHPVHSTALSMLGESLPAAHYMIAAFGGADVRCTAYAPFGTQELSNLVVEALADRTAALLGNHGAIALGATLSEAMRAAQELETLARMYLLARQAGQPRLLSQAEIADAVVRFTDYRTARTHEATA